VSIFLCKGQGYLTSKVLIMSSLHTLNPRMVLPLNLSFSSIILYEKGLFDNDLNLLENINFMLSCMFISPGSDFALSIIFLTFFSVNEIISSSKSTFFFSIVNIVSARILAMVLLPCSSQSSLLS